MGEPVSVLGSSTIEWRLFAVERPEPGLPVLIVGDFGRLVEAELVCQRVGSMTTSSWRIGAQRREAEPDDVWAYRPTVPTAAVMAWR